MAGRERRRRPKSTAWSRQAAALAAVAFAALVPALLARVPPDLPTRLITPGWMPQQVARVLELSSDLQVGLGADRLPGQHPRISLVLVTDTTLDRTPYLSPVDRGLLAQVLTIVDRAGPAAIGLDFIFDRPTEPAKDAGLKAAIRAARAPVVVGALDERIAMRSPRRAWQDRYLAETGARVGYLNLSTEIQESSGNPIVRYRSVPPPEAKLQTSFTQALARAAGTEPGRTPRRIAYLGRPLSGGEPFVVVDADALLATAAAPDAAAARFLARQLAGRVVIIAGDVNGQDRHRTPLAPLAADATLGAEVHAHMLAQLLDGRVREDLPRSWLVAIASPLALLSVWLGTLLRPGRWSFLVAAVVAAMLIAGITAVLLTQFRFIVPAGTLLFLVLAGLSIGRLTARWMARQSSRIEEG